MTNWQSLHSTGQSVSYYVHFPWDVKPKVSLPLSHLVWGRVVIVLVNERVSINTPKASFSSQPPINRQCSAEQLREGNKPESRLRGKEWGRVWLKYIVRRSGWGTFEVREGEKPGNCNSRTRGHKWGWRLSESSYMNICFPSATHI